MAITVCQKGTGRKDTGRGREWTPRPGWLLLGLALAGAAYGQTRDPAWRRIGNPSAEILLAGPVTGPVDAVWFTAAGDRLLARTRSGKLFQTDDFETWTAAPPQAVPPSLVPAAAVRMPEAGARVVTTLTNPARIYALGDRKST